MLPINNATLEALFGILNAVFCQIMYNRKVKVAPKRETGTFWAQSEDPLLSS